MFLDAGAPSELNRWATAASLVEKASFDIAWAEPLIGPNGNTVNVDDEIYSNDSPGTAILAAPIYALTRLFIGLPDASNIRISWFVMRFFISTVPILLLGLWLYARETDELSLAILLFATPLFAYSLLLFSHVFAAVVIYFAFRVVYDQRYVMPWHAFLGGILCGIAIMCEFAAVIPSAVFAFGLLFADKRERLSRPLYFMLGALPFVLLLGWYNYSLFGSPFTMPYIHEGFPQWAQLSGRGIGGIIWLWLSNLYLLLLSPSRGLFFTAPILLLSITAFFTSREVHTIRHRTKITAIFVTVFVVALAGNVYGGAAFGPRYLLLIVPLLLDSFFDGELFEMSNFWQGLLFGLSSILCLLPVLTFTFAPPDFTNPYRTFWGRLLFSEHLYSPNLANVFGADSVWWNMAPVVVCFVLTIFLITWNIRRPRRFLWGIISAVMAIGLLIFFPGQ